MAGFLVIPKVYAVIASPFNPFNQIRYWTPLSSFGLESISDIYILRELLHINHISPINIKKGE